MSAEDARPEPGLHDVLGGQAEVPDAEVRAPWPAGGQHRQLARLQFRGPGDGEDRRARRGHCAQQPVRREADGVGALRGGVRALLRDRQVRPHAEHRPGHALSLEERLRHGDRPGPAPEHAQGVGARLCAGHGGAQVRGGRPAGRQRGVRGHADHRGIPLHGRGHPRGQGAHQVSQQERSGDSCGGRKQQQQQRRVLGRRGGHATERYFQRRRGAARAPAELRGGR
mmetsp:Transcript_45036/g.127405  ORF Transcript_45036/g.127405 Transcript_45036/m.127405 type:complete len:226 (-) Transcript_45036:1410-2087(-)